MIAIDETDPAIDVQIAFNDFTAAGGSFSRIPLSSSDVNKLRRLTDNFNLLNIVVSDEPGSGPAPPPPVTRDVAADVESGAPGVSADAEVVPAAVRDTAAAVAAGAPTLTAQAEVVGVGAPIDVGGEVETGAPTVSAQAAVVQADPATVHDTGGDVAAGAPTLAAQAEVVPAAATDVSGALEAGAPAVSAGAETVPVGPPSDVGAAIAAGAPGVEAEAETVGPGRTTAIQRIIFGASLCGKPRAESDTGSHADPSLGPQLETFARLGGRYCR